MERTFFLFGCVYDVSMIDESLADGAICFELSIGSSGLLNSDQLVDAVENRFPSLTRIYPKISMENGQHYHRLPIDAQKPVFSTKYKFHDYSYRIFLSNRLKNASKTLVRLKVYEQMIYQWTCRFRLDKNDSSPRSRNQLASASN